MQKLRTYGNAPFHVALIHGGPGAGGEMAPVARQLASHHGILEPIQTADTLPGQIQELKDLLIQHADFPVTLVGYSWGSWLGVLVAAEHPRLVKKLILVSSGPFEQHYAKKIEMTRLSRLGEAEQREYKTLVDQLTRPEEASKSGRLTRLGALAAKSDAYDPIPSALDETDSLLTEPDAFRQALNQALEMRKSGNLLEQAARIQCPVVAIHGDYDPHPVEGVQRPLAAVLPNFHLILLEQCGHKPWLERQAKKSFYNILRAELF